MGRDGRANKDNKMYTLINHTNGAIIRCREKYIAQWISRGFEITKVEYKDSLLDDNNTLKVE